MSIQAYARVQTWIAAADDSIELNLSGLNLNNLPLIPDNVKFLNCSLNILKTIPPLPQTIIKLNCSDNLLTQLPKLPGSINYLNCMNNRLKVLPTLPGGVNTINCKNNRIKKLPRLPKHLEIINCSHNLLEYMPNLPECIQEFICHHNKINDCPCDLPKGLRYIDCSHNDITVFPNFHKRIQIIKVNDNPTSMIILKSPKYRDWFVSNSGVHSIPYIPTWVIKDLLTTAVSRGDVCPITHEPLVADESVMCLPCFHIFNKEALAKWVEVGEKICPKCRAAF